MIQDEDMAYHIVVAIMVVILVLRLVAQSTVPPDSARST